MRLTGFVLTRSWMRSGFDSRASVESYAAMRCTHPLCVGVVGNLFQNARQHVALKAFLVIKHSVLHVQVDSYGKRIYVLIFTNSYAKMLPNLHATNGNSRHEHRR